jgi:hypothetical protein
MDANTLEQLKAKLAGRAFMFIPYPRDARTQTHVRSLIAELHDVDEDVETFLIVTTKPK